ncbi:MAG: Gldg family protein [Gemmatimonadota bacterium]
MRHVWTLARRELRSFFDHPTAYVLQIAFLVLALFLAIRSIYANSLATLRPLFDLLPWLFAIFVPAITMRSFAEERQARTLEWLLVQPFDERALIAGKFLGNWLFVVFTLACTLPLALGVLLVSDADPGIVVAQYTGSALLAALLVALGLWASSVTRNQITAFILATALTLLLVLLGAPVVRVGLPPRIAGLFGELGVMRHFEGVARGVLDLRDVLYFAAGTAFFLVLAGFFVARERLSPARAAFRRLRLGTAASAVLAVLVVLLGNNVPGRLDLTRDNLYTLSAGTRSIVRGLDDLVTIKLFISRELPLEVQSTVRDVRDLIGDIRAASDGRVAVEEADPDRDDAAAEEAQSFGITPIEFNVLRDDEFQVRRGWFGLAIQYADAREVIPIVDRTDDLELRLATAIGSMTREGTPTIGWATGSGMRSQFEFQLVRQVLSERWAFEPVALEPDSTGAVAAIEGIDLLVLASPSTPLADAAVRRVEEFVAAGNPALLLLESHQLSPQAPTTMPIQTGLDGFLESHGVRIGQGIVYDLRSAQRISMGQQGMFSLIRAYPWWPIAFPAADHPTVRDLSALTFGWAAPVETLDSTRVTPLWTTSEAGGVQPAGGSVAPEIPLTPDPEALGPVTLAVAVEPDSGSADGRLIVTGDASFLEDQFVRADPQGLAFLANAADWLGQDESLIDIRSKNRVPPPLVFSSEWAQDVLKWGCLLGVPGLLVLFGAARVGGRVGRARRHWSEVA